MPSVQRLSVHRALSLTNTAAITNTCGVNSSIDLYTSLWECTLSWCLCLCYVVRLPSDTGHVVMLFSMSSDAVVAETKDETEEPVDLIPTLIPLSPDEVCICIARHFVLCVSVTVLLSRPHIAAIVIKTFSACLIVA